MHAGRQPLRLDDALQQRDELQALRRVQGRQQHGLLRVREALELGEQLAARRRQVERVGAPVGGIATALGESPALEVVDERDDGAAVDSQRDAEGLLGLALGGGEVAEHPEMPRVEAAPLEALGEAPVRVGAQLHEQEADAATEVTRRGRLLAGTVCGHVGDGTVRHAQLFLV